MSEHASYPRDFEDLSPERAQRMILRQQEICMLIDKEEVTQVAQIPPSLVDEVRLHVITCSDSHRPIQGLYIDEG